MSFKRLSLLFLFCFSNLIHSNGFIERIKNYFQPSDLNKQTIKLNINDLSGTVPYRYFFILNELKNLNENAQNHFLINRLILYGPPGNGKSVYAKKLADEIDADIVTVKSPLLVDQIQDSGAHNVDNAFEVAYSQHNKTGKRVVIFFDEISSLINSKEKRFEHELAVQALWLNLDKIKNDPNFFVILTTNDLANVHPALLDRFGDNIIEFSLPDKQMRYETIEFYSKKFDLNLERYFVVYLVKQTDKLSIRAIEDILKTLKAFVYIENRKISYSLINSVLNIHKIKTKKSNQSDNLYNRFNSYLLNLNLSLNVVPGLVQTLKGLMFIYLIYNNFLKKDNQTGKKQVQAQVNPVSSKSNAVDNMISRGTIKFL